VTDLPENQKKTDLSGLAQAFRKAAPYVNSTYVLIGSVALFGWLGWLGDQKLSTTPLLFILGLFGGLASGFYNFYKILKKLENDK
jgi:ATP synthase protein I